MNLELEPLVGFLNGILGEKLKDLKHLEIALTHRSYANETGNDMLEDNERYEFLGDAVLQLSVSDLLMKRFPQEREGVLSKCRSAIVNERSLAQVGRSIDLGRYIRLGRGEELTQGRQKDSILANTFEAVVAAIYFLQGMKGASAFVSHCLQDTIANVRARSEQHDHKTSLQEFTQRSLKTAPVYRLVLEDGPDHAKIFESEVLIEDRVLGRGRARSKKDSEQKAAEEALSLLVEESKTSEEDASS